MVIPIGIFLPLVAFLAVLKPAKGGQALKIAHYSCDFKIAMGSGTFFYNLVGLVIFFRLKA